MSIIKRKLIVLTGFWLMAILLPIVGMLANSYYPKFIMSAPHWFLISFNWVGAIWLTVDFIGELKGKPLIRFKD